MKSKRTTKATGQIEFSHQPPDCVAFVLQLSSAGPLLMGYTASGAVCRAAHADLRSQSDILLEWQRLWPNTIFRKLSGEPKTPAVPKTKGKAVKGPHLKLFLVGTAFQHRVWKALLSIPEGQTMSYGAVARQIGSPGAARAVGTACKTNLIAYLVPAHRVIASNGRLGGYLGRLTLKRTLLDREQVKLRRPAR